MTNNLPEKIRVRLLKTMTPHPQRCETCKDVDCEYYSYELGEPGCSVIASKHDFTAKKGCASHSSQQSGRDKVLENIIDLVEGRIVGLDNLLATPPEQRTESAQDKYLKEARFELGLVREEYKELRQQGKDGE